MIELINTKKGQIVLILIHVVLGVAVKYAESIAAYAYVLFFAAFAYDVILTRDRHSRAGFYCIYIMGMEMIYRIVGAPFSWELGKYLSILILIIGALSGNRKYVAWNFIFLLILLIPGLILAQNQDPVALRKQIMFNISGPLSLVFSGIYFYARPIKETDFVNQIKFSFLPAITTCIALSLVASVAEIEFKSLQSNTAATGGFAANQVSSM
jgi:uncharacterized membrane protein